MANRPKPKALKLLDGTQKCRINFDEPIIPIASTVAPEWLTGFALEHWNEYAPILATAGMLTQGDRACLIQLCLDYRTIREADDGPQGYDSKIDENWKFLKTTLRNADKAKRRYRLLLIELGLTPAARTRLRSKAEPSKGKLAAHLDKAKRKA